MRICLLPSQGLHQPSGLMPAAASSACCPSPSLGCPSWIRWRFCSMFQTFLSSNSFPFSPSIHSSLDMFCLSWPWAFVLTLFQNKVSPNLNMSIFFVASHHFQFIKPLSELNFPQEGSWYHLGRSRLCDMKGWNREQFQKMKVFWRLVFWSRFRNHTHKLIL